MHIEQFKEMPFMGILRGISEKDIPPLVETVLTTGLKTLEITMNTQGAAELIRRMVKVAEGSLTIGAGTVLSLPMLKKALEAGAEFIVSPTLIPDVVSQCVKNETPVFPGAFTPQEIYTAHLAGASMVKVFPTKIVGPEYLKEIKGPFPDIELMACGGVNSGNINAFFENGASAVAFGGSIFKKSWLREGEFDRIAASIQELISSVG